MLPLSNALPPRIQRRDMVNIITQSYAVLFTFELRNCSVM